MKRQRVPAAVVAVVLAACQGRSPTAGAIKDPAERPDEPPSQCLASTNRPGVVLPQAVYFGSRVPTLVPLSAEQMNAVVAVTDEPAAGAFCSGTLIAPAVVMTARHCTDGYTAGNLFVLIGEDDLDPIDTVRVDEIAQAPGAADVSLLRLTRAPRFAAPIPVDPAAPDEARIGTLLEQAGFGATHDRSHGRYFVAEKLAGLEGSTLVVDGEGFRGVCFGDSGGPSLHVSAGGDVRVLGALSEGDAACMKRDRYERADLLIDFIEAFAGPVPAAAPAPCGDVDARGRCSLEQAVASYCEAGRLIHDACDVDELCGPSAAGNRCLPRQEAPCGGLPHFGTCADGVLRWCDDGTLVERDCEACGERCLLAAPSAGFACVPSDCGDLDLQGRCDGDVARWCDALGQRHEVDCAARGQPCTYVGEELGFFCYDAAACGGLTYQGECRGSLLRWCEDNAPQAQDCAATGERCVFIDDDIGFDCRP